MILRMNKYLNISLNVMHEVIIRNHFHEKKNKNLFKDKTLTRKKNIDKIFVNKKPFAITCHCKIYETKKFIKI